MNYRIVVSKGAQNEIETTIDYYALLSKTAPKKFVASLQQAYRAIQNNPFFEERYLNVRSLKLDKFPHSLYFIVNENDKIVKVLSCFHNSRNPVNRPKK